MRLIDADSVKRGIEELKQSPWYNEKNLDHFPIRKEAVDVVEHLCIDKEPTIDAVPAWIPVTERLPEHEYGESQSVLAVDLFGVMRVTYFDGGNWCLPSGEALTTLQVAPITHWMPLPEPPKEE